MTWLEIYTNESDNTRQLTKIKNQIKPKFMVIARKMRSIWIVSFTLHSFCNVALRTGTQHYSNVHGIHTLNSLWASLKSSLFFWKRLYIVVTSQCCFKFMMKIICASIVSTIAFTIEEHASILIHSLNQLFDALFRLSYVMASWIAICVWYSPFFNI